MIKIESENQFGVKGAYSYQVIDDATNEVILDVKEQTNLLLDYALSLDKPFESSLTLCIGAGVVTPPTVSDIDLGNQIKSVNFSLGNTSIIENTSTHVLFKEYGTSDFTGFTGQEVSEIGIRSRGAGTPLLTRALIKDANGNPTTITVGAGQTLRITYSVYFKFPKIVASGVLTTPYGDLPWVLRVPSGMTIYPSNLSKTRPWFGRWQSGTGQYKVTLYTTPNVHGRADVETYSYDTVNRKCSVYMKWPAMTSDATIGRLNEGEYIIFYLSESPMRYAMCVDGDLSDSITLPANYDFSLTWEGTWGRLP